MWDIPFDILGEIFRHLSADTLWRLRNVCKAWRRVIDDPSFVRFHSVNQHSNCSSLLIRDYKDGSFYSLSLETLNHTGDGLQTIELAPVQQLMCGGVPRIYSLPSAVCNGLILIRDFHLKHWVIWNPLTRDFHQLPPPDNELLTRHGYKFICVANWCLGYDLATDDYKVVRIDQLQSDTEIVFKTRVYSLKLGCWRFSKDFPCDICCYICTDTGVFLDGAIYWRSPRSEIIMFDLGTEDYTQLQGPALPRGHLHGHLVVMEGCLVSSCYDNNMSSLEGWIMRDLGVEKSWMKLFSIRSETEALKPVAYMKGKSVVVLHHETYKTLYLFDIENDTLRNIVTEDMPGVSSIQFSPGSLLRLNNHNDGAAATTSKAEEG